MPLFFKEENEDILVGNNLLTLRFGKNDKCSMKGIYYSDFHENLMNYEDAPKLLFKAAIKKRNDEKFTNLTNLDAKECDFSYKNNEKEITVDFKFTSFLDHDYELTNLKVLVTVKLEEGSPLSAWNFEIEDENDFILHNLTLPYVSGLFEVGKHIPGESVAVGRIGEGYLFENLFPVVDNLPLKMGAAPDNPNVGVGKIHNTYPGNQQMQFILYYNKIAGLYLATHDDGQNVKTFDLDLETTSAIHPVLSISHLPGENLRKSFRSSYDTMVGVFKGDWCDGADIYKEWALKQWWCEKKLIEKDIPEWFKDGFGIFNMSNYNSVYINELVNPMEKIADTVNSISKDIGKPISVVIFNWEGEGAWTGPVGMFPPREGQEVFQKTIERLARAGNNAFAYTYGGIWFLKIPFKPDELSFDSWNEFNAEGKDFALMRANNEIAVNAVLGGWQEIRLCPANKYSSEFVIGSVTKTLDLGFTAIQIDCFPADYFNACYNPNHDHAPGYGAWWSKSFAEILREARKRAKDKNPNAILSTEGICEVFIPSLELFDHRSGIFEVFSHLEKDFPAGGKLIPLFNYVYNDIVGSFSSAFLDCTRPETLFWTRAIAKPVTHGAIPNSGFYWPGNKNPNKKVFEFYKTITRSVSHECWKYLMFGKMLRPPITDLPLMEFSFLMPKPDFSNLDESNRHVVKDLPVYCAAFQSADGDKGHIFINVTEEKIAFNTHLGQQGSAGNLYDVFYTLNGNLVEKREKFHLPEKIMLEIEPLSILLVELKESQAL